MPQKIKVTLVKSLNGRPEKHRKILQGMGLRKINRTIELQDIPSSRGMVNAVSHLVKVAEIKDEA